VRLVRGDERTRARGKFLFAGGEKIYVRGATYGAFRPDASGREFHDLAAVERDFAQMAASGLNAVRIPHTIPPRALLDVAQEHGLRVMVGLSVEQEIGFLIDGRTGEAAEVEQKLRARVRSCAGHPALLCYALGNEIPAPIVRYFGRRRVERFLRRMYRVAKDEDPQGLVTYVNYPTTEYLELPFLDLLSFNVYLESSTRFSAYLARLHNIAGDRPLLMSELGLDALRNGKEAQARALDWQIRGSFAAGCAGVFVFSWTDEWYRAGSDVEDWQFGLTDAERRPKPALATVRGAFAEAPLRSDRAWPRISVIVCSYNGGRTIRECCEGLSRLHYPDFEVIVVDDGSTDDTADIAGKYDFRVIRTPNHGLSSARNTGLAAATGEIVAYLDDDAHPDPDWLGYLAETFARTEHVGVGGPNVTPIEDGPVAWCVANSPGNPTHVLLTDEEAEHLPGCNMAFRRSALEAIGGFDPRFRAAGDDVDACWRLRERGGTLGFSPAAMVWHHRRSSIAAYLRQQRGYGAAEGLLQAKWRSKHGPSGYWEWQGRIYGAGNPLPLLRRPRVYHGVWGHAPFQSIYERAPGTLLSLPQMPEFHLVVAGLLALGVLGALWKPLVLAVPLLILALALLVGQAVASGLRARFPVEPPTRSQRLGWVGLTALLHLLQPPTRLWGRLRGCAPAAPRRRARGFAPPMPNTQRLWSQVGQAPEGWLEGLEAALLDRDAPVARGGHFDSWDLEVANGPFGGSRSCMAVEDHEGGQLVRLRTWPRVAPALLVATVALAALAGLAAWDGAGLAAGLLATAATALAATSVRACGAARDVTARAFDALASVSGRSRL
jgi:GT2 family glycosyltransferase